MAKWYFFAFLFLEVICVVISQNETTEAATTLPPTNSSSPVGSSLTASASSPAAVPHIPVTSVPEEVKTEIPTRRTTVSITSTIPPLKHGQEPQQHQQPTLTNNKTDTKNTGKGAATSLSSYNNLVFISTFIILFWSAI